MIRERSPFQVLHLGEMACENCEWTASGHGEDIGESAWFHERENGHEVSTVDAWRVLLVDTVTLTDEEVGKIVTDELERLAPEERLEIEEMG